MRKSRKKSCGLVPGFSFLLSKYLEIRLEIPGFPKRCTHKLATVFFSLDFLITKKKTDAIVFSSSLMIGLQHASSVYLLLGLLSSPGLI
jgi:hypothetical protein